MTAQWNESMSTGILELDGQHQQLIQQLVCLEESLRLEPENTEVDRLLDLFDFLDDYARRHFADEERQMELFQCESREKNARGHECFLETLAVLRERFRREGATANLQRAVADHLLDWFVHHVCTVDTPLKPSVEKAGATTSERLTPPGPQATQSD